MATERPPGIWPDPAFDGNRRKYPREKLLAVAGQHVAWSGDGTHIVAHGATVADVLGQLHAQGIMANQVVFGFVDEPDVMDETFAKAAVAQSVSCAAAYSGG